MVSETELRIESNSRRADRPPKTSVLRRITPCETTGGCRKELCQTFLEAFLLGLVVLLFLIHFGRGFGPYWDTWFYYDHAVRWSDWFASWWGDTPARPLTEWRYYFPNEPRHPPLMEWGGGLCHTLFRNVLGRASSVRLFVEISAACWSAATYLFLKPRAGRSLASIGVVLFWGSPRFLVHAVLYAIDGLIAAVYGLTLLSFLFWDRGWKGKGLVYASLVLALLTKLQALYLIPILFLWVLWFNLTGGLGNTAKPALRLLREIGMAAGVVSLAFLTFFILWPALWLDFPKGLADYLQFLTKHGQIPVLYFGALYKGAVRPPWHYPFLFTLIALPLTLTVPVIVRMFRIGLRFGGFGEHGFRREEILLWTGMLFPLLVSALPSAPKYDGVRLLLPAYGPLSLLATLEIAGWWRWLETAALTAVSRGVRGAMLAVFGVLLLLPTVRIYPYNLVYYSPLIGGPFKARERGFDLDYLGVSQHLLNPAIRKVAKQGDILLLAGCNTVVSGIHREGWVPVPDGVHPVDFKMIREIGFSNRRVFAIIGSRYGDLVEDALVVLKEIPPLATVEFKRGGRSERLFSLHEITPEFVDHLKEIGSSPVTIGVRGPSVEPVQ